MASSSGSTDVCAKPLSAVAGVRLGSVSAGLKADGLKDLLVIELCSGASVAAVFTQNAFCAAPVKVAKENLLNASPRALLVNAGNANAGTGSQGIDNAIRCCESLAESLGLESAQVLPFSTGVIGEPLPLEKLCAAMPAAVSSLSADGWGAAAQAIMTTDTVQKGVSRRVELDAGGCTITGIAKGAGMIKPNMATMLSYVASDAKIDSVALQVLLAEVVERSFNRITIDGDTSTNDAAVLIATGASGVAIEPQTPEWDLFAEAVQDVFVELAQAIVRDGEGASKFVSVDVSGGASAEECLAVAYVVAESPLVKTALFASDANWGRILAAIGRAGVPSLDVDRIRVRINGVLIVEHGARHPDYREQMGAAAMSAADIVIAIELGRGNCRDVVWTSDLSHEYIRINAEYRS